MRSKVDDFIGREFTTPKGGVLTVVGVKPGSGGKRGNPKMYLLECSTCGKDGELFPDLFESNRSNLLSGWGCCGCGKGYKFTEEQQIIRIKRECNLRGYRFIGFVGTFKGASTYLKLLCLECGTGWDSTNITKFFCGSGCDTCARAKNTEACTLPDIQMISSFLETGCFLEGTTFSRNTTRKTKAGKREYWDMYCPSCSEDEYVRSGTCNGVFTSTSSDFKLGKRSCRCVPTYRWTKEQREMKIVSLCKDCNHTFLDWLPAGYYGVHSEFEVSCTEGYIYKTSVNKFVNAGYRCPCCCGQLQTYAYISIIYDEELPVGLKYGITTKYLSRVKDQSNRSIFKITPFKLYEFSSSDACKNSELTLKRSTTPTFSKREVPDGYSETTSLLHYERIVKTYRMFGGWEVSIT